MQRHYLSVCLSVCLFTYLSFEPVSHLCSLDLDLLSICQACLEPMMVFVYLASASMYIYDTLLELIGRQVQIHRYQMKKQRLNENKGCV